MKKNLILLTGIVFLITVLAAVGCSNDDESDRSKQQAVIKTLIEEGTIDNPKRVRIYVKDTLMEGNMHLLMYDSNDPDKKVIDTLYTLVLPGMKVIWKIDPLSRIERINKIGPSTDNRNIFHEDASERLFHRGLKLRLEDGIEGPEEKYDIEIIDTDGKTWPTIDPYLKIPPGAGGTLF